MADMKLFNDSAFESVTFTDSIQDKDFQPSLLGDMGIFEVQPSRTTGIMLEQDAKTNSLIAVSLRGEPISEAEKRKRNIRTVEAHKIAQTSTVYSDEVLNVRAYGKTTELMQVKSLVADGIEIVDGNISLTEENMRLGAVQGIVVDADGVTVLNNWFTFWGITQSAEIAWNLAAATVPEVKSKIRAVHRTMEDEAKGLNITEVIALCGNNFFDALENHEVYTGNQQTSVEAQRLVDEYGRAYSKISLGNIVWINYRGSQSESAVAINTDEVKFFPKAKGLFKHGLACASSAKFIGRPGMRRYVFTSKDMVKEEWFKAEIETYPLFYCTKPKLLLRGKVGA